MMNSRLAKCVVSILYGASACLYPTLSFSLGLGDLQIESRLNQPLHARIEVAGVSDEDWRRIQARLAKDDLPNDGLARPDLLDTVTVTTAQEGERHFLEVKSRDPLIEPLFDLPIAVSGEAVQIVRNYAVMLDPPAANEGVGSGSMLAHAETAPVPQTHVDPVAQRAATPAPVVARPAPQAQLHAAADQGGAVYTVGQSDTLGRIVHQLGARTAGDRAQLMQWIYEHNPTAFYRDMHHLHAGARLVLPQQYAAASGAVEARPVARVAATQAPPPSVSNGAVSVATLPVVPPVTTTPAAAVAANGDGPALKSALQAQLLALQQTLSKLQETIAAQDAQIATLKREIDLQSTLAGHPAGTAVAAAGPAAVGVGTVESRTAGSETDAPAGRSTPAAASAAVGLAGSGDAHIASATSQASASSSKSTSASVHARPPVELLPPSVVAAPEAQSTPFWKQSSLYYGFGVLCAVAAPAFGIFRLLRRRREESLYESPVEDVRHKIEAAFERAPSAAKPSPTTIATATMPVRSLAEAVEKAPAPIKPPVKESTAAAAIVVTEQSGDTVESAASSGIDSWRTQTTLLEQDTDVLPFVMDAAATSKQLELTDEELAELDAVTGSSESTARNTMMKAAEIEKRRQAELQAEAELAFDVDLELPASGDLDHPPVDLNEVSVEKLDAGATLDSSAAIAELDLSGAELDLAVPGSPERTLEERILEGEVDRDSATLEATSRLRLESSATTNQKPLDGKLSAELSGVTEEAI